MAKAKQTSRSVASKAARQLANPKFTASQKAVAGSACPRQSRRPKAAVGGDRSHNKVAPDTQEAQMKPGPPPR